MTPARLDNPLPPRPRCTRRGNELLLAAPAKINLDLLVGPPREDGFHPLDSVVAKVTLYDRIILRPRADSEIRLRCRGADCGPSEDNLAVRAARLLADRRTPAGGVDIDLAKSIPPGAGLGGGSSDAAAVLAGLDELWGLGMSPEALSGAAAGLGSDVPLFLAGPAARMTGRGECLQPVRVHPFVAVLYTPPVVCPTAAVYRAFDALGDGEGFAGRDLPDLASDPPSTWRAGLRNDLAAAAEAVSENFADHRRRFAEAVGIPAGVTGSGSGLFALCDDAPEAAEALARLPDDIAARTRIVAGNPW